MPSLSRVPEVIRVTVGVQISEDVPVPGGVLVGEGIRVPENIQVLERFRVLDRKKLKLPDPKKSSTRTPLIKTNIIINYVDCIIHIFFLILYLNIFCS